MNQIYVDNDRGVSLGEVPSGTVFICNNDYYIRTDESDELGNILCVTLKDGYVAYFDCDAKIDSFRGTLRIDCS